MTTKIITASDIPVCCSHSKIVDVTTLIPNPRNPNQHPDKQIALLAKIIRHQGWRNPIVVSKRSGFITKGHGRLQAANLLKVETVPVDFQEYENEASEWADVLADNRISELSENDNDALKDVLQELDSGEIDMDLTGYDEKEIEKLMNQIHQDESESPDKSDGEKYAEERGIKDGDIWVLGEHRILCGSCLLDKNIERLMNGSVADTILTDPPYGVSYEGKTKEKLKVEGDDMDEKELQQMVESAFNACERFSRNGSYWYATVAPGPLHTVFAIDWKKRGVLRQILVWVKDSMVLGHSEYNYRHEPILFGWKKGNRHKNTDRTRTTVFEHERPKSSKDHPTMKPVGLWCEFVKDGSRKGEIVFDPFSGSGTSIIACEMPERRCYCSDISPAYVGVAIKRWEDLAGRKAIREQ